MLVVEQDDERFAFEHIARLVRQHGCFGRLVQGDRHEPHARAEAALRAQDLNGGGDFLAVEGLERVDRDPRGRQRCCHRQIVKCPVRVSPRDRRAWGPGSRTGRHRTRTTKKRSRRWGEITSLQGVAGTPVGPCLGKPHRWRQTQARTSDDRAERAGASRGGPKLPAELVLSGGTKNVTSVNTRGCQRPPQDQPSLQCERPCLRRHRQGRTNAMMTPLVLPVPATTRRATLPQHCCR